MITNLNEHEKCIKNSNHIVKIVNKIPKYVLSKFKGALGHTDLVQHKINKAITQTLIIWQETNRKG